MDRAGRDGAGGYGVESDGEEHVEGERGENTGVREGGRLSAQPRLIEHSVRFLRDMSIRKTSLPS